MKIRIKSGDCPSYLTVGKVYEVVDGDELGACIVVDDGSWVIVNFKCSGHLKGGSWEVVND